MIHIRETHENAINDGIDVDTGLHRTGLEEYLAVIFPNVNDWVHNKTVKTLPKELKCRKRPDYRSEELKLIIEFDGKPHYDKPQKFFDDYSTKELYEKNGYKVVRIPFFIQLTNKIVKQLFGVDVKEPLFNENIPSMGINGLNPAKVSGAGLFRMAKEFHEYPQQYRVNVEYLKSFDNDILTGANILEEVYKIVQ